MQVEGTRTQDGWRKIHRGSREGSKKKRGSLRSGNSDESGKNPSAKGGGTEFRKKGEQKPAKGKGSQQNGSHS